MPALDYTLYGATRGFRDANRDRMEEEAFSTDQAIRRERLSEQQALAPMRQRAAELGIAEAERQAVRRPQVEADEDELRKLGVDVARMNAEERKAAFQELSEAREKEQRLKIGLGRFHTSGDPQAVADAIAEMYPKEDGSRPVARRNDDGSITLSALSKEGQPTGKPITLKSTKINGVDRSADDQLAMFAFKMTNPMEHLKQRYATDLKVEAEGAKQDAITERAIERERIRSDARVKEAEAKADKTGKQAVDRGVRLGKTFVDSSLKTVSVPGHFQATYSSEDDAKLLPHIYERMGEIVRKDDQEPEAAAKTAITDVRTEFLTQKRIVMDAAARLQKAGIDPRNREAVAAKKDDPDVKEYLSALGKITRRFGPDVGNYLLEQVPVKKK